MKSLMNMSVAQPVRSHPSRGAWIEIAIMPCEIAPNQSHPSRGAWIEMPTGAKPSRTCERRTPHGVRGLK